MSCSWFLDRGLLAARWCNECSSGNLVSRDLMSWINGIRGLVSSDELAKDVTGAEALLERHQVGPAGPVALPVPMLGTRA